tara:strand:+ start:157056 stop:157466 length:411 start_codon:yes stop_codon:yes gene_type:complete
VIFLLIYEDGFSQALTTLDSLKTIFWSHPSQQTNLELLYEIGSNELEPDSAAKYSNLLLEEAIRKADDKYVQRANHLLGAVYRLRGDYEKSLEFYFKSVNLAAKLEDFNASAMSNIEIGNVYSKNGFPVIRIKKRT